MFVNVTVLTSCSRSGKETDASESANTEVPATDKSKSKRDGNTIIWGALIISMLANAVFTIILSDRVDGRANKKYHHLKGKYEELKENINWNAHQNTSTRVEQYRLSEADINLIVDRVLYCMHLTDDENGSSTQTDTPKPFPSHAVIKKLYASAADNNMHFMEVFEQPQGNTIYLLSLTDNNNAEFELLEDAKEKVIGCEDFINNACNKLGNGSNIGSCEPGRAERTSDGFWKVTKKANVKFV